MWHFHPTQTPKEHFPRQRTPYKKYTTDEVDLSVLISHFKMSEKKVFFFCVKFISKQLFFKHIHSPGKIIRVKAQPTASIARMFGTTITTFWKTPRIPPLVSPFLLGHVCSTFSVITVVEFKGKLAALVVFRHKCTRF